MKPGSAVSCGHPASVAHECVKLLQWAWLVAQRHLPHDRALMEQMGGIIETLLERNPAPKAEPRR
jgi:hypothetical protein